MIFSIGWRPVACSVVGNHLSKCIRQVSKGSDIQRSSSPLCETSSSHGLPNCNSWEDLTSKILPKSLILLVGATGFEPVTCSTQNCRATRLRYTPITWKSRRYTLTPSPARRRPLQEAESGFRKPLSDRFWLAVLAPVQGQSAMS
jgi:hypothetical protein